MTRDREPLILIVDDDPDFLAINRHILEKAGYRVATASEPAEALQSMAAQKPDLVITDYRMPNCSGESLIKAIREDPTFRTMKILVLSSHSEEELVERLGHYGLEGYLLKGQGMQTLVERVGEIVAGGSSEADS